MSDLEAAIVLILQGPLATFAVPDGRGNRLMRPDAYVSAVKKDLRLESAESNLDTTLYPLLDDALYHGELHVCPL